MNWKVPYFDLELGEDEKAAISNVVEDQWLTGGPRVQAFESHFAALWSIPADQAIAVTNCTAALHLALLSLDIGLGDEVVCPSLTFVATANAIKYTGAEPIFVDICSEEDWTMDPADVEAKITAKTKAIMVMHYGGYPCDMSKILEIANKNDLAIVEDACHGPLNTWNGQLLGLVGDVGCFSFYSNKNMTTGEGGMIVTNRKNIATRSRSMRSHGMTTDTHQRYQGHAFGYDVIELGYNYRMDELRAALGIVQLAKLAENNSARADVATRYKEIFGSGNNLGLGIPFGNRDHTEAVHVFPVLLPRGGKTREDVMAELAARGIQTSIHYRPVHSLSIYQHLDSRLPVTDNISSSILSLPLYPHLSEEDCGYVVQSLRDVIS